MTYAVLAEETARALNDLIIIDAPQDRAFDPVVLACREHLISATRERLRLLVGQPTIAVGTRPRVSTVVSRPLPELDGVLRPLPSSRGGTIAPTALLPGPPAAESFSPLDRWRCAARTAVLANNELLTAVDKPWVSSDAALWHLSGDI